MRRLLPLGRSHRNTALQAYLQSRKPLALLVALVLCLFAFVFTANEARANEQPSSTEQTAGESTLIVNGTQVAEPASTPASTLVMPPLGTTLPVETPPNETLPPPFSNSVTSDSVNSVLLPKAEPEPASQSTPQPTPMQRTMVVTTTGDETVRLDTEPASAPQQSDAASTTTTSTTTPSEPVSANAAPTTDLGTPETEIPAAAEEVPAALPAGPSAPSEASKPMMPAPALLQQVAQDVPSEEQAQAGYYFTLGIAPSSAGVQPLTWGTLTDVVGTSASAAVSAVAGVLGTVGSWLSEASSSVEDSSSSGGTWTEPFTPVIPEPLGSSFIGLFPGMGQASAGGAGTTLLLGVLFVASILLLRRDLRTYLISCELPKPSSALLSPLERPG